MIMAKGGGGKNAILLIIAVAAIGGAVYLLMNMGVENPQDQMMVHYMDPESVMDDPQDVASMTQEEFAKRRNDVILSSAEADERRARAGQCPNCEKFFPLIGHGETPDKCPVCDYELAGDGGGH